MKLVSNFYLRCRLKEDTLTLLAKYSYFLRLTKGNRVCRRRAGDHDGRSKPTPV